MNLTHPLVLFSIAAAAVVAVVVMQFPDKPDRAEITERTLPEQRRPLLEAIEVEGTRTIGEDQTITTIRIPDAQLRHNRHFDRYCVVYEHHAYRSVHVVCDRSMSVAD